MNARPSSLARSVGRIRAKFGNVKTTIGGEVFDSKREARRWGTLCLMVKGGHIRNLRRQVKYDLIVNAVKICTYTADFVYDELLKSGAWREVVEDSKGYPNDRWPMKKKLMLAVHGVEVFET
jgi:hypothetical protein